MGHVKAAGRDGGACCGAVAGFQDGTDLFGLDLGDQPSYRPINVLIILPILSGVTSFLLSWVTQHYQKNVVPDDDKKKNSSGVSTADSAAQTSKMMMYMMPIMSVVIGFALPAGITVYWILNNLFSMAQEPIIQAISKKYWNKPVADEEEEPKLN